MKQGSSMEMYREGASGGVRVLVCSAAGTDMKGFKMF